VIYVLLRDSQDKARCRNNIPYSGKNIDNPESSFFGIFNMCDVEAASLSNLLTNSIRYFRRS